MHYTQNRELSWLNFNKRVLQVGAEPSTPLFERMKFVSIFQSNLSEFFMIRVGGLHDMANLSTDMADNKSHMTAQEQLDAIYAECVPLEQLRDEVFDDIEAQLAQHGVKRHSWSSLDDDQRKRVSAYVQQYLLPILSPQIIDSRHPFPHLQSGALYVVVELAVPAGDEKPDKPDKADKNTKGKKKGKKPNVQKNAEFDPLVGLVPVPSMVPRLVDVPGDGVQYILVEDVIAQFAPQIFDVYDVKNRTAVISVTRNADINPDDEAYDDDDYRQHMKKILKKRKRLAPVRLMVQGELRSKMLTYFCKRLDLSKAQTYTITSPIDLSYVFKVEDLLSPMQRRSLLYAPFAPVFPATINRNQSMFEQIRQGDIMLSYPFDSMEPLLDLLKEAARDPEVISIKITLYRLARYSKIAEYLAEAAENGKDVTALLELRARFDEEANIGWAERFEDAGCTVLYGFEGYKVHSKICQITRRNGDGVEFFTQLSTGNYNEKTAAQYTDIALMTADRQLGLDGIEFFNNMALGDLDGDYKQLWVSPTSFKDSLIEQIDQQIQRVAQGLSGRIVIKCNSVTDLDLINKLSEASGAGVHVQMIVRGICCLLPGVEGYTDNIDVTSIVGRLLEHSRIYCFGEGQQARIWLASADMMTRNTERRVEIGFPVLDSALRTRVLHMLDVMLHDTARAKRLLPDGSYERVLPQEGEDPLDSQAYFMHEAEVGYQYEDAPSAAASNAGEVGPEDAEPMQASEVQPVEEEPVDAPQAPATSCADAETDGSEAEAAAAQTLCDDGSADEAPDKLDEPAAEVQSDMQPDAEPVADAELVAEAPAQPDESADAEPDDEAAEAEPVVDAQPDAEPVAEAPAQPDESAEAQSEAEPVAEQPAEPDAADSTEKTAPNIADAQPAPAPAAAPQKKQGFLSRLFGKLFHRKRKPIGYLNPGPDERALMEQNAASDQGQAGQQ